MSMTQRGLVSSLLTLAFAVSWALPARAGLDDYVKKADPAYAWNFVSSKTTDGTTVHWIKLTSQVWQGSLGPTTSLSLNRRNWPTPTRPFSSSRAGRSGMDPATVTWPRGSPSPKACQARVVVLPQVPNQPLLGGKNEDTLDRRDVRSLPSTPRTRSGPCSSPWSRVR